MPIDHTSVINSPMFLLLSGVVLTALVRILTKYLHVKARPAVLLGALILGVLYTLLAMYTPAELKESVVNFTAQMMGVSWVFYEFAIKNGKI